MSDRNRRRRRPEEEQGLAPFRFIAAWEAQRLLGDARVEPDPRRIAEGWAPRFVADGARAEEMVQLYQELGFEVVADPVGPGNLPVGCEHCRLLMELQFRMIYTRNSPAAR